MYFNYIHTKSSISRYEYNDIPLYMYVNSTFDVSSNISSFPGEYPVTARQRSGVTQTPDPPRVA